MTSNVHNVPTALLKVSGVLIITACMALLGPVSPVSAACEPASMGSAQLSLTTTLPQTVPGAAVGITAHATDIDGLFSHANALAVEVTDPQGSIVDRFFAVESVKEGDTTFVWHVPTSLTPGTYTVNGMLVPDTTSYGDAFTNVTLPRATVPVAITSDIAAQTSITPAGVTIIRKDDGSVALAAIIANDTDAPYDGQLTWRVWKDTTAFNKEPILMKTLPAKVHPHTSATVELMVPHAAEGTYYIEAKATNDRFVSYAGAWMVDGAVAGDVCTVAEAAAYTARLWYALALVVILMLAAALWNHFRRKS